MVCRIAGAEVHAALARRAREVPENRPVIEAAKAAVASSNISSQTSKIRPPGRRLSCPHCNTVREMARTSGIDPYVKLPNCPVLVQISDCMGFEHHPVPNLHIVRNFT